MTVEELMRELNKFPMNIKVVFPALYGGYNDIKLAKDTAFVTEHPDWEDDFDEEEGKYAKSSSNKGEEAVVITFDL